MGYFEDIPDFEDWIFETPRCLGCNAKLDYLRRWSHCPNCGQKLDNARYGDEIHIY